MSAKIDKLIINSAFREPESHWRYDRNAQSFEQAEGRRPAGYFIAGQGSNAYNDIGLFFELETVNKIRKRVKAWRTAGYPGVTGVTKKLLDHWNDPEARQYKFFFCQLDAIETLIWLVEGPASEKTGIAIPGDGGAFRRICTKMCTGGGKTTVMAMLIAWMVCNKVVYPTDKRFSKHIFIVGPGLTVKTRLQVLKPGGEKNYYDRFNIVPWGLKDKLNQGEVEITNCQALGWESAEDVAKKKGVDKRGALSDEAYVRSVLGRLAKAKGILVINDEAHHAWRRNPEVKVKLTAEQKKDAQDATVWVGGLDRIHKVRGIMSCYDFSATPFAPSGKRNDEEALFGWIVSDFGLNDGIESGLVKTPRVVVRDDVQMASDFKSKLYHIYSDETVKDDVNRAATPEEPLPDLVQQAYYLLGKDWQAVYEDWRKQDIRVPPVMISVVNRTETAARVKYMFDHARMPIGNVPELCEADKTIHIDSKTMDEAESEKGGSKKEAALALRKIVDTVGKTGEPGEQVRNVVSVGMLTEGWDAQTVTHILGLRAFSSQLLCEQVVGRGLRRTSYDLEEGTDIFAPEYVNIFGIPFSFLPHEEDDGTKTGPVKPKTQIEVVKSKAQYAITWPNILRIEHEMKLKLEFDYKDIPPLTLDANETRIRADLAPIVEGKTDLAQCTQIDLEKLDAHLRMQTIVFNAAAQVYEQMAAAWKHSGTKYALFGQVVALVERYLASGKVYIDPGLFYQDELRKRLVYMMNMNRIVQHLWGAIRALETARRVPVFAEKRVRGTGDMQTWFTSRPCWPGGKCHISHVVFDDTWEASEAYRIENHPTVAAWVKNDHLGFNVTYTYQGVVRKYIPDFLIRLSNGLTLVLEVKGRETEKDRVKREALKEWVDAVNECGEFGRWACDISYQIADVDGILQKWLSQ